MQQVLRFLKEVKTEFGNISWPKKDSLIQLTFVVISISLIISLILGGFDYLFTQSFNLLIRPSSTAAPITLPTVAAPQVTLSPTITLTTPTVTSKPIKK
jgi:preprotein translocase subunit SecE